MDVVLGAGGFLGGHLVGRLLAEGRAVKAIDIKPLDDWHQRWPGERPAAARYDLTDLDQARRAVRYGERVFLLAADMGGMGFIETHKLDCAMNVVVTANVLRASAEAGVGRLFYSSSACVYPAYLQDGTRTGPDPMEDREPLNSLREDDAYPAMPEDGYGWEKLYGERLCRHFQEETDLETRVARYHNIYGPHGTWRGGREKAPAALCRKVAEAVAFGSDEIEVWGDGTQYRSYTYVDDCIEGTLRLMDSDFSDPVNIGSSEGVTVDELLDVIEKVAGTNLNRTYDRSAPRGVAGRNSDNALCREVLGWEPYTPLRDGIDTLYRWVLRQVQAGT